MKRGHLYRVHRPSAKEPKKFRVYVVVSRQAFIESRFSTVICAPVYSSYHGLSTQVEVGIDEGLKHASSIHCDELISVPKSKLTNFVGALHPQKMRAVDEALQIALGLD